VSAEDFSPFGLARSKACFDRARNGNVAASRQQVGRCRTRGGEQRMVLSLATIALVVGDYDDAIGFFRDSLGFALVEDTPLGGGKRWVVVKPPGGNGAELLLARADGEVQRAAIGRQAGGRVGFFLETDDFFRDFSAFSAKGVRFLEAPREEPYGVVAVFEDICGNRWDLIEPTAA
jgi:catechol 2,3-dioxygenase-like lactoylglutathione lyase family enzyme